jgi:hypothetical protein
MTVELSKQQRDRHLLGQPRWQGRLAGDFTDPNAEVGNEPATATRAREGESERV